MKKILITKSFLETQGLGRRMARECLKFPQIRGKKALILALQGNLGGGKTTFVQGFAKGLGIKEKVLSPTFIIMRKFQIPKSKFQTPNSKTKLATGQANSKFQIPKFKYFYHLDCYRIQKPKEIMDLGFKELIAHPENIVTIEWAEKIKKLLPKEAIFLNFVFVDKNTRKIIVKKGRDILLRSAALSLGR